MAATTHDLDEVMIDARNEGHHGICVVVEVGEVVLDLTPGEARSFGRQLIEAASKDDGRFAALLEDFEVNDGTTDWRQPAGSIGKVLEVVEGGGTDDRDAVLVDFDLIGAWYVPASALLMLNGKALRQDAE